MGARPWFDGGSPLVSIFLALGFASLINLAVELVSGRRSDSSCCPACWHCCPACWHCCPVCWHCSPVCWHCSPVCWHCCPVGFCIWKQIEERFLCLETQTPFLYLSPNRETFLISLIGKTANQQDINTARQQGSRTAGQSSILHSSASILDSSASIQCFHTLD